MRLFSASRILVPSLFPPKKWNVTSAPGLKCRDNYCVLCLQLRSDINELSLYVQSVKYTFYLINYRVIVLSKEYRLSLPVGLLIVLM